MSDEDARLLGGNFLKFFQLQFFISRVSEMLMLAFFGRFII